MPEPAGKPKVLIADDQLLIRQFLKTMLHENGFDVVGEAVDGTEAVTLYERLCPDIVCLDISMPKMDGIRTLEEIKSKHPQTVIIMISAFSTMEKVSDAIAKGANGFIVKPLTAEKVLKTINECIKRADDNYIKYKKQLDALRMAYAEQLPGKIGQIEALWKDQLKQEKWDNEAFSSFRAAIHSLAGSSGTFGFISLGNDAGRLNMLLGQIMESAKPPTDDHRIQISAYVELLKQAAEDDGKITAAQKDTAVSVQPEHEMGKSLIFLVEDDQFLERELSLQLGYYGYTVRSFSHPAEIKEALKEAAPSAIVMDVMFPEGGLAGIETIADIKKSADIQMPVIFITVSDDMSARLEAARVGANAYFTKPIDIRILIERLDNLTKRRETAPYRILIVDDEPEVVEQNALILQQAGMKTEKVTDPMKAVKMLSEFMPDLILMDIYMPGCNGVELTSVIRQHEEYLSVPILFLSVESDMEKHLDAMLHGGDHFLVKPVSSGHLILTVTVLADRYRKLRSLMKRDSMTGLLNHTATVEQLNMEIERSKRRGTGLVFGMIDLDNFKSVNDTYGHPSGDHVLKGLSMLLHQRLRKTDITGRYGGEEFAVILIDTDTSFAMKTIEDIRESFALIRHRSNDGPEFSVTLSCGIAAFPEYEDAASLINAADKALYKAKNAGRNMTVKG